MDVSKSKQLELWCNQRTQNELLEDGIAPTKIRNVWCEVIPQTGQMQRAQADTLLTNCTHKVKLRYLSGKDITPDMWLMFRGRRFDIKYILNPRLANEDLEIFVQEVIT